MDDNPYAAPDPDHAVGEDADFDRQLARMWMNRTWTMAGTAMALVGLSFCCNPFGIVGIVAIVACVGGAVRSFGPPAPVRPHLGGTNLIPGILCLIGLLPSAATVLLVLGGTALRSMG